MLFMRASPSKPSSSLLLIKELTEQIYACILLGEMGLACKDLTALRSYSSCWDQLTIVHIHSRTSWLAQWLLQGRLPRVASHPPLVWTRTGKWKLDSETSLFTERLSPRRTFLCLFGKLVVSAALGWGGLYAVETIINAGRSSTSPN